MSDPDPAGASASEASAIDWQALERATHVDPAGRGLLRQAIAGQPWDAGNLAAAAQSLARGGRRAIIVTGFCRLSPQGMTAETDGPPGALLLAQALAASGIDPVLVTDRYGLPLLEAGCDHLGLPRSAVHIMPIEEPAADDFLPASDQWCEAFFAGPGRDATHLIAIERPGPSHTLASLAAQHRSGAAPIERFEREVPPADRNRCHTMRGERIDRHMAQTQQMLAWIERAGAPITTIGIGDGGNELGMGSIPWEVLADALGGETAGRIICRVAVDHLLLAGVSDWGAYALALTTAILRGAKSQATTLTAARQAELLRRLISQAGAVDGLSGEPTATVDGLRLDIYLAPFVELRKVLGLDG